MNFFAHYNQIKTDTEKRNLRNKIIQACVIQHSTFYPWLHRKKIPPLAQKAISQIMQKEQSELFPK